jgi:Domain of Unknown Function (DUF1206)
LVGWLALQLALQVVFGGSGGQADQKGAVSTIAAQPLGSVVLWALAVLLIAFGVWQWSGWLKRAVSAMWAAK